MSKKRCRRSFLVCFAFVASVAATSAMAQFGGHQHDRSGADTSRSTSGSDAATRAAAKAPIDPIVSIERELPSLQFELKLTVAQAPLFNQFEREIHNAAEAGRWRTRHFEGVRDDVDDVIRADTVLGEFADDDSHRAEAMRLALGTMGTLYAALTTDQRAQFDQGIVQSLRAPPGDP